MDLVWRTAYLLLRARWGFDKESPRQWRPAISVDDETVVEGRKVKSAKGMFDGKRVAQTLFQGQQLASCFARSLRHLRAVRGSGCNCIKRHEMVRTVSGSNLLALHENNAQSRRSKY